MGLPPQAAAEWDARCAAVRNNPRLVRKAWQAGALWWLLDANQFRAYQIIRRFLGHKAFFRYVLEWARRTGKTFLLLVIVVEESIRNPKGRRYNVAAATKDSLREFVWPALEKIFETCPEDLRPLIQDARGRVTFVAQNKGKRQGASYVVLAGCDNARSVERLRGPFSNGNIIEEAGAVPDSPGLVYVMRGVLNPQLMTTNGWTLMAMTPPKSVGSEASVIAAKAAEAGAEAYDHCTLYDNPRLTPHQVEAYLDSDASILGMTPEEYRETPDYQREWLAIRLTDPTLAVLPEATPQRMDGSDGKAPAVVREMETVPMFRDRWVGMDLGFHPHYTHLLFGYWDFERQVLVVEDEIQRQRLNDTELAHLIRGEKDRSGEFVIGADGLPRIGKERELWGEHEPFMRVADNNYPMTLSELATHHDIVFVPTAKDEKEAAIVQVRRWLRLGKIAIHPRCKKLIAQVQAAVWNKHRTEFAQVPGFGHFDAVDALIYLVRNVIPHANREPPGWGFNRDTMHRRTQPVDDLARLRAAFGG